MITINKLFQKHFYVIHAGFSLTQSITLLLSKKRIAILNSNWYIIYKYVQ